MIYLKKVKEGDYFTIVTNKLHGRITAYQVQEVWPKCLTLSGGPNSCITKKPEELRKLTKAEVDRAIKIHDAKYFENNL